jgi:poly-beta-1,6-N-acetyl-D-glucosamine N-deacetylase
MRSRLRSRLLFAALGLLQAAGLSAAPVAPPPARGEPALAWPADTFAMLCYHDVRDQLRERPDLYTVETRELTRQFAWLRAQGYHVVSIEEVIAARREHRRLPDRAVVLSFDDGLQSVYTRAFPLLEAFNYPAVVGLVGAWLAPAAAGEGPVQFPDETLSRADFLRPEQILEMRRSGLIEFASHSYAMHVGAVANPQGNLEPAAAVRLYDAARGGYESDADYRERIRRDLARSSDEVLSLSGARPRIIVWPYGDHNRATDAIARDLGMPIGFTLEVGLNTPDIPLSRLRRTLVTYDFTTADLARVLQEAPRLEPLRMLRIDLDDVYDADANRQEANLSRLLDRVKAMGINTVFLQASADPGHTGAATALYFPNRRLPVRADLLNRVAWQLRTRTGVAVYARLPLLAFDLPGGARRLSPLDPGAQQAVRDMYEDLATFGAFQGLAFGNDATGAEFDQAGAAALAAEVGELVRSDHDDLRIARDLPSADAGGAEARAAFAHRFGEALAGYDYVVLGGDESALGHSLAAVAAEPGALAKAVFELRRAVPPAPGEPAVDRSFGAALERLRSAGARNIGYYPDDFRNGRPALEAIRPAMSLRAFPGSD